jgi:hypothetical protein
MATVKKARRVEAHWSPNLWYICTPNKGNPAGQSQPLHNVEGCMHCLTAKAASRKAICS